VTIRNSIIVSYSADPELQCDATVTYTATEAMEGGTNTTLGDMSADWFSDFDAGDFHLNTAPAALATTAQWQTGDPLTDIDGQPRPNTDGAMDYAGADLP
jgi:hypothetical protein